MVFESLINPLNAEKKPWRMFFLGMLYSSIAVLLSIFIFKENASLVMIFLTVLPCTHLIFTAIKLEEHKDLLEVPEKFLLREHSKVLSFLMFLFLGFVASFSVLFMVLPESVSGTAFDTQMQELEDIREIGATGSAVDVFSTMEAIFINNVWVMVFSILFAFFYGAGAIFVLTWNASVLGVAIGKIAVSSLHTLPSIAINFFRYSIHGIPEMLAYFMAGLGGSIISVALVNHDFRSAHFRKVMLDSADLVVLAIVVLGIAAFLEVFITPLFF